ncbi:MAG: GNAT family N-acetyltransferase [Nitrospirae bacterium]|nr:GNAT family N-acetyltransferase [Nitrospirota bacterium]
MTREKFNIDVITDFEEFRKLRDPWTSLLEQSRADKVFLTHEWFSVWWEAFGGKRSLFVILVKKGGEILGIAPLMRGKSTYRGFPVRNIECMGNNDSPGFGFITKKNYGDEIAGAIISFLFRDETGWDIISCNNMFCNEDYHEIRAAVDRAGRKCIVMDGLSSPYLMTDADWETYFKSVSTKSRKTLRNISNRIKKLGSITVSEIENPENLDDIISVSKRGWKYKKGLSFINRSNRRNFFEALTWMARRKKWLSIWCMYKDGVPVAYEYHLKYKGNNAALLSEFDIDYENYSPGAYLDYEIVRSLFEKGVHEYDMCGSQDEYKKKWSKDIRQYKNMRIFNNTFYSGFLYSLEMKPVKLLKGLRDKIFHCS